MFLKPFNLIETLFNCIKIIFMSNRRKFIKQLSATGVAGYMPSMIFSQKVLSQNMICANMLSLHYNRSDNTPPEYRSPVFETNDCRETWQWARQYRSFLTFDEL